MFTLMALAASLAQQPRTGALATLDAEGRQVVVYVWSDDGGRTWRELTYN